MKPIKALQEKKALYLNSSEYLLDECKRMELLLRITLKKNIKQDTSKSNNFPNLFISEEEINGIIQDKNVFDGKDSPETEALRSEFLRHAEDVTKKKNASINNKVFLSLSALQNLFRLNPFEVDVLILSLLPELDRKYERIYGYLQDDITSKRPTIGLILEIFPDSAESKVAMFRYFLRNNNLFKYEILKPIDNDNNASALSRALKMDNRILNYLFEINEPDAFLLPFITLKMPEARIEESGLDVDVKEKLLNVMKNYFNAKNAGKKLFINLDCPYGSGKKFIAEALCGRIGVSLLIADVAEIIKADKSFEVLIRKVFREGILQPAAIYFENVDRLFGDDEKTQTCRKLFFKIAEELSLVTFFSGDQNHLSKQKTLIDNVFINIKSIIPDVSERKKFWKGVLEKDGINLEEKELHALSNKFKFTKGQIIHAVSSAKNIAMYNSGSSERLDIPTLYEGCKLQSNHKLSTLAQRVKSNYTWADIILPKDHLEYLMEITGYIKHKDIVYDTWGFNKKLSLGRGLNILFSGHSGTGKTMAAGVIANELNLELYKIDLSSVVSKYIGETEKNLSKIFNEADTSNAILFFDEADALFGKRTEVKDAHDRYANIEVNYLLQKMEEHEGIIILATNLGKNVDDAFLRRMQFVIEFPFPDEIQRELIWRIIFPKNAPFAKNLDYKFLSEKLKITGGVIKNIALTSAFYAAEEASEIKMNHIMFATKREYQKMGKSFLKSDLEPYYELTTMEV